MSVLYPETFKEICESVLEETDGRSVEMDSVALGKDTNGDLYLTNPTHRNVVSWVAGLYQDIQFLSPRWSFLHKRGKFLTVVANKYSYKKPQVREVDLDSFYFIKTGETARTPLTYRTYEWWKHEEQYLDAASNTSPRPIELVDGPGEEWILWPTPTAAGAIYGDWSSEPEQLLAADDKPVWEPRYNDLLKWGALRMYASEFSGEGSGSKLLARFNARFPVLWNAFTRDYLPPTEGAPALF